MTNILTRVEEAAVAMVEDAYKKLPTAEAKAEFHSLIGVYSAHPLAMFASGICFGLLLAWAAF